MRSWPFILRIHSVPSVVFCQRNHLMVIAPEHRAGSVRPQLGGGQTGFSQQPADIARPADMLCRAVAEPADAIAPVAPGGFRQAFGHGKPVAEPTQLARQLVRDPVGCAGRTPARIGRAKEPGTGSGEIVPMGRYETDIHRSHPRHARAFQSGLEGVRGSAPRNSGQSCGCRSLAVWRSHEHDTLTDRLALDWRYRGAMRFGSSRVPRP